MQSYLIKASSKAHADVIKSIAGRRFDATPLQPKVDVITKGAPGFDKDGLPTITGSVVSEPYLAFELLVHDDDALPAWPEGVVATPVVSSFAFASVATLPQPGQPAPLFPDVISDRQFAQGLAHSKIITQDEALAWVGPGTLPPAMTEFLGNMPQASRFDVEMVLTGATQFSRRHTLTTTFGTAMGMTPLQLDQFWMMCAAL